MATARPRITGTRNRRLFEGVMAFLDANSGQHQISKEFDSHDYQHAPCIFAKSYRALVRAVGFFKYNNSHPILLRGQTSCHGAMKASLHRRDPAVLDRDVDAFLRRYRKALAIDTDPAAQLSTEPLLQHYGIETRWLDVVDSIPHALFFATHRLVRSPDGARWSYVPSVEKHGFIYLMDVGVALNVRRAGKPVIGFSRSSQGLYVADLRKLKPGLVLRPHIQHGLGIRATDKATDLWNRLVARIAIPTDEGRRWILGQAFERSELFPPRTWDGAYGKLLSSRMERFLRDEVTQGRNWGEIMKFDFHE